MRRPSRRSVLLTFGSVGLGLVGARCALPRVLRHGPPKRVQELSPEARALVERSFADVDRKLVWDAHTHLVGLGTGDTGCWVNPDMLSHWHPIQRLQFDIYLAASGVADRETADRDYLDRLVLLHRYANPEGKLVILAFDFHVGEDGREQREHSPFHTPNRYALDAAKRYPELLACASVHPYRKDAVARLEEAAAGGAVAMKWLPNAMGIDPASPKCDPFYAKLAELRMPLITHAGLEKAVHAEEAQRLGNPLRLRRALDAGVRVVVAHCASLGTSHDIDAGGEKAELESFDLFLRLMGEKQYEANLFGEISALTQVNRSGEPLRQMLRATDLHPRLVNGSDYPLPAIDPLVSTRLLESRGYLSTEERKLCNEIFDANPLLFDYVVKRCVKVEEEGRTFRFAPVVFESGRLFA